MPLQGNFATTIRDVVDGLTPAANANISEAIFQSTFGVSSFANAHTVMTGVRDGGVIPIVLAGNYYGSMPVGNEKSCSLNSCDTEINYSDKVWGLAEYNCRSEICFRNVDEDFLVFWNGYRQRLDDPLQAPDMAAIIAFITDEIEKKVQGTMWRVGYLGDTESLSNLISGNDGFFVQAEAGNGVKINIDEAEPTAEEIYEYLTQAYESLADKVWGAETDLVWKMTWAMANKFVTFLNTAADLSLYNCDCINPDALVAGRRFSVEGLRIFGIPVEVHREIDLSMAAISQTNKYQALLIRKSNLLVGTNTTEKMDGFEIFFDRKERKVYIDSIVYLGVSIPLDDEYVYISNNVGS